MRTTIEIPDEQRAKLLEIAAREQRVNEALSAIGSLDDEGAQELRESMRQVRERWR